MAGLRDGGWADRVEELLYDGESVRETVDLGPNRVVVTSHRVLAFTPDGDGANFQQVDRPNVVGVSTGARTRGGLLQRGIRWAVIGGVLAVAGWVIEMDALLGDFSLGGTAGSRLGVGGVLDLVRQLVGLLRQLDELLLAAGVVVLALAAVALGAYWLTREPTYVLAVAGDEADVHVPRTGADGPGLERLEAAIAPDGEA